MVPYVPFAGLSIVAVAILGVAVTRTLGEPRRPSNGLWWLAGAVFAWLAVLAAQLTFGEGDSAQALAVAFLPPALVICALIGVVIGLVLNTPVVVRREGLRVATLVPLAIAAAITVTLVGSAWWLAELTGVSRAPGLLRMVLLPILIIPGAVLIFQLLAYAGYALLYSRTQPLEDADVIVVLGAGLNNEQVTPLLASRLDKGIQAWEVARADGRDTLIVVSGGQGPDEVVSEAAAMAAYLRENRVPDEQILLEDRSTTTGENLRFTAALLAEKDIAWDRMLIVTNNFHVLRAASLARGLGIDANAVGSRTAPYYLPSAFLREFAASVVHYRRGTAIVCAGAIGLWLAAVAAVALFNQQSDVVDAAATGALPGSIVLPIGG